MNKTLPSHIAPWLRFPRSPMELFASIGITAFVGLAIAVAIVIPPPAIILLAF